MPVLPSPPLWEQVDVFGGCGVTRLVGEGRGGVSCGCRSATSRHDYTSSSLVSVVEGGGGYRACDCQYDAICATLHLGHTVHGPD